MRAWRVDEFGEPTQQWRLAEDAPDREPGAGQIKVAVEACGLGLPDVLMCRNNYPLTPPLPFTPSIWPQRWRAHWAYCLPLRLVA